MRNLEITKASSGEEALQVLETDHNIEVIILDVKMPGMDGIETLVKTANPTNTSAIPSVQFSRDIPR